MHLLIVNFSGHSEKTYQIKIWISWFSMMILFLCGKFFVSVGYQLSNTSASMLRGHLHQIIEMSGQTIE